MRIIIFELSVDVYETITDYLSNGWCEWVMDNVGDVVDVKLSNFTKFTTVGNGVLIEFMGRSALLDRTDYNYIKIE